VALVTESTKTFLFRTFGFVSVKSHFLEQVRDFEEEREDVHVRSLLEDACVHTNIHIALFSPFRPMGLDNSG